MAERLTELKVFLKTPFYKVNGQKNKVVNKLGQLEDILEKYGIESVEELDDFFANYKVSEFLTEDRIKEIAVNEQRKVLQPMIKEIVEKECNPLYTELNIWERACELACEKLNDCFNDEQIENGFCYRVDTFYQQAKKENNK